MGRASVRRGRAHHPQMQAHPVAERLTPDDTWHAHASQPTARGASRDAASKAASRQEGGMVIAADYPVLDIFWTMTREPPG
jgi:hypothetical protein